MSFFGKLKSGTGPTSPSVGSSPQKKDTHAPGPTPLEKLLTNAGPLRIDGSDKFFGMENFGNTCYCNSILQCLYYSTPFRDTVLSYPKRSSPESVTFAASKAPLRVVSQANAVAKKPPPANRNGNPSGQGQNKDDKDSPEYKKKQALTAGPILNISYGNATSYDMPESLFTSLKDVFEAAATSRNRTGVVSPIKLLEVLRKENEMFRSAMHQDAHEFLNLLLNAVVEEIEKHEKKVEIEKDRQVKESVDETQPGEDVDSGTISFPSLPVPKTGTPQSRWLQELFEGTLTSETRCLTCENTSQRDEPFLDLSVDLEQHSSVTSCLRRFSEEEMLCERNKFHCDNCGGLQEAEKRMKIKRLPKILALHLKRFKYTEDLARLQKLFHRVVYPYHLRLFNTTDDAENPDRLYELYAVVVHIGGGPYHGHYVAIIKTQDRGWLLFDDEMVEPVDRSFVRNFFGERPGLACAYVLFYQETTLEAMQKELQMEGRRLRNAEGTPIGLGLTAKESAELHRVYSAVTPTSPTSPSAFANLDHAVTAPPIQPNGHILPPISPPLSPVPSTPAVFQSPNAAIQAWNEKQKQKENTKAKEIPTQKTSTTSEEDLRAPLAEVPPQTTSNGTTTTTTQPPQPAPPLPKDTGLDRFKRTSKSLRFGSLSRKDKEKADKAGVAGGSAIADDPSEPQTPEKEKEKEKKSRFSIRKKSFGMLSSEK